MITIIGTGHVFDLSSNLNSLFDKKKPDLICVELDNDRYNILSMRNSDSKQFIRLRKNVPLIYLLFMRFQEKTAKKYGVNPGDEMLAAIKYAQVNKLPYKFIDTNYQLLYNKLINSLSTFEKIKLSILAVSLTVFGWYILRKNKIVKDLDKFDNNFDDMLKQLDANYPILKRIILDERNEFMARKLIRLRKYHKNILACVGDGHVSGISKILDSKNIDFETVKLKDLTNNYKYITS